MVTISAGRSRAKAWRKKASASRSFKLVIKAAPVTVRAPPAPRTALSTGAVSPASKRRDRKPSARPAGLVRKRSDEPIERHRALARQITGKTGHGCRLAHRHVAPGMARQRRNSPRRLSTPPSRKILKQRGKLARRQCRRRGQALDPRGLRRAAPPARCRARARAPPAARCRIATNPGRRAGAPGSPWRGANAIDPQIDRHRVTQDRANARAARSAGPHARPPTPRQDRRDRCRRTTTPRYRPATGRDPPLRRCRRDRPSSSSTDASQVALACQRLRDSAAIEIPSVRSRRAGRPAAPRAAQGRSY